MFVTYQIFPLYWRTLLPDTDVEESPLPVYVWGWGGEEEDGEGKEEDGEGKEEEEEMRRER